MARSIIINLLGNNRTGGAFRGAARDADRTADSLDRLDGSAGRTSRSLSRLGEGSATASKAFSALTGKAATLTSAVLAVAPAAGAAGAAMVAAAGAGAAAFASAGAAIGAFTAAAQPQLTSVADAADLYAKAQEAAAEGGEKAAKANKAYTDALAKMPPATRETAKAFIALKEEHKAWSDSLSADTMPIFTRGINIARKLLPKLTPLVRTAAGALSDFMGQLEKDAGSKGFAAFLGRINDAARKSLPALLRSARNVAIGIGGIVDAFLPHSGAMASGIEGLTAKFARWGQSLKGSEQFRVFIDYVRQHLPALNQTFQNLVQIFVNLGTAMAPMSGASLEIVKGFTGILAALPPEVLGALAQGFIAVSLAMRILNPLIATMNVLMRLNPIGLVVLALAGLALGLYTAYKRSETFRNIVQGAWRGVQGAASTAWGIIKPILDKFAGGLDRVFGAWAEVWPMITELIDSITEKFGGIGRAAQDAGGKIGGVGTAFQGSKRQGQDFEKWAASGGFGAAIGMGILGPLGMVVGGVVGWFWPKIKGAFTGGYDWLLKKHKSFAAGFNADSDTWQGRAVGKMQSFMGRVKNRLTEGLPPLRGNWTNFGSWFSQFSVNFLNLTLDAIKRLMSKGREAFAKGVDAMGAAWNRLKKAARDPVNFVIRVFNDGIVGMVENLARFVGMDKRLPRIPYFAAGGILPGYAPGRDSLIAAVSPGEAVMRPEFTRAVGPGFIHEANRVARQGGPNGVRNWLAGPDALGGEGLAFAHGGIVPGFAGAFKWGGIIGDFLRGVKNFTIGNVERGARVLLDKVLGGRVPGSGMFRDLVAGIPGWIKGAVLGWVKKHVTGGVGGPAVQRALAFAKAQAGKPYVWGGVGPGGYDCSGFMSALTNVIQGKSPYARRFTTFSFTGAGQGPAGFQRNLRSGFTVGVTNAGVGHMAGTLGGVNVESSGGAGVRVGGGARGTADGLFSMRYGLKFDEGGMLPAGWSTVYNGLGRPEPVFPSLEAAAAYGRPDGPLVGEMHVHHVPGYSTPDDLMRGLRQAELEIRYHRNR